jgi:hypothetical protein
MREGQASPGMTIRVFYPNPVGYNQASHEYIDTHGLAAISKLYNVTYIMTLDPIYHELVFIDDKQTRHTIIGLAYHLEEKMEEAGGIDVQA